MDDALRNVLKHAQLTNSDLEAIYMGRPVDLWVMVDVIAEYEGPDGWHVIEYEFVNMDISDPHIKYRGLIFTARVFYKICGPNDPYGREGRVWESDLLGERNYPW